MKNLFILSMLVLGFACTSTPKEEVPATDTSAVTQESVQPVQDSCAPAAMTITVEAIPATK